MGLVEYTGNEVTIMACSDCNTKCKHCYIGYSGNFTHDVLLELCLTLLKRYKVSLNGTELLLHPEYFDIMQLIEQDFIITNGLELSKNPALIHELCKIGIKYVGISDHFFIHETISSVNTEMIENLLKVLSANGFCADIRTTITSQNYNRLNEMCDLAYAMGASGIKFTNYIHAGAATELNEDNILLDEQLMEFFRQLEIARSRYDKSEFNIRRCGTFGYSNNGKFHCPAINESVIITPDLKVYPCIFLARRGYEIGIVKNNKIFLYDQYQFDGKVCMAMQLLNKKGNESLTTII